MRIAVIGSGAAGMSCSWLLASNHDVVCYEAAPVLGGNGRNETVVIDGEPLVVAPGATFFPPAMNRLVLRLMRHLEVPLETQATQFTLSDEEGAVRYVSPSLRPLRLEPLGRSGAGKDLAGWTRLLVAGRRLAHRDDWATPWRSLRTRLGLGESFLTEVADPVLAALWGVTLQQVMGLSARAALGPAVCQQPTWIAGRQRPYTVSGGTGAWFAKLAEESGARLTVRTSAPVGKVVRTDAGRFRVHAESGDDDFDRLVLAVSPWTVAEIAPELIGDEEAAALAALPETPCVITVHGDSKWVPAAPRDRSSVTMVTGPDRAQLSTVAGEVRGQAVYRSWSTWNDRLPEPLFARYEFRHVRPDPVLFDVQAKLPEWQERAGLRFAGSWVRGFDCHETAVGSATLAAAAIDPLLPRLALLGSPRP